MSGFVPRDEYEERHAALRERYEAFAKRSTRILTVLVLAVLLTGGLSAYLLRENLKRVDDTAQFSEALQASIIQNCETSGNPLRQATREFGQALENQIREELRQSAAYEKSGAYRKLFPDFDPHELHVLLKQNEERGLKKIAEIQKAVEGVEEINCRNKYSGKSEDEEEATHEGVAAPAAVTPGTFVVALSTSEPATSTSLVKPDFWLAPPPGSALLVP